MAKCTEEIIKKNKIAKDFNDSENIFEGLQKCVTFFGSARVDESSKYSKMAEKLSYKLAKNGVNIVTGGGGGIMQAANKGAFAAKGGESIGLNIKIPKEQNLNPYTNRSFTFNYFFSRKFMLVKHSQACVVFPGGYGTLDELFEVATLMQTGRLENFKIYLIDTKFWKPMIKFIKSSLLKEEMIDKVDIDKFILTDDLKFVQNDLLIHLNLKNK